MPQRATRHCRLLCILGLTVSSCGLAWTQVSIGFPPSHKLVVLSVPDKASALQLDIRQLKLETNTLQADAGGSEIVADDASWQLTATARSAVKAQDTKMLRAQEQNKLPAGATQVSVSELGSLTALEYFVEAIKGRNVHQKHVMVFLVGGDLSFSVHISKLAYYPDDERFFSAFLGSLKIIENFQPDSRTRFGYGNAFYHQKDWSGAIQQYEKTLDLERERRALPQKEWRVLVDNLGMAYAASGDLPKAKQMFEFGITQDPEYPMFHYHLACAEAGASDLDGALLDLTAAFRYHRNSAAAEALPDPARDSSFEKYLNDPRFRTLAQQLCPSSHQTQSGFLCD